MPPTLSLPQFSGRQIEATSGFRPRLAYADLLRDELPNFYAARQAGQQNRSLDLSEQQMEQQNRLLDIQAKSLQSQEEAQASAQKQQTIGSGIQGVSTLGQGGFALGKEFGLFGGGNTASASEAAQAVGTLRATPSLASAAGVTTGTELLGGGTAVLPQAAYATGTAADAVPAVAAAAATGTQAVVPTGFASLGTLGGAAAGASVAGVGLGVGSLVGKPVKKLAGGGFKGEVASHAAGAAAGALVGAGAGLIGGPFAPITVPVGAVLGAIGGGLGASFCICTTVCYGKDSEETSVARAFRDAYMSRDELKGYYALSEIIVPQLLKNKTKSAQMRDEVFTPMIRVGRYMMKLPAHAPVPSQQDVAITQHFLAACREVGEKLPVVVRSNGERIS